VNTPASAHPSPMRVRSSSPPICSRWIPGVLVVLLMVKGLLVMARGTNTPSPATLCALCQPVLFSLYFDFLCCVYCLPLQPVLVDFRSKL
jgi:hypothetical protein